MKFLFGWTPMVSDGDYMISIIAGCKQCHKRYLIKVKNEDYEEYQSPNCQRSIQQIFPYLSPAERELFISGICGECFDKIFNSEPEEDEDKLA